LLVLELVAEVVDLVGGGGLLQDQGHDPGKADGLSLLDALLLSGPPIELREREVFLLAFAL
jgi:hypothetical protein